VGRRPGRDRGHPRRGHDRPGSGPPARRGPAGGQVPAQGPHHGPQRPRRAAHGARPGLRRPRAARPRPALDRAQAHHRGHGGGQPRGGEQAHAPGGPGAAVRRRGDL
ncbi:MAG: hypothetical protein AVDCRST_MAG32-1993, partial [uncultured Nocardioides sp.]